MKEYICEECGARDEVVATDMRVHQHDRITCHHCTNAMPRANEDGYLLQYLFLQRTGSLEPIDDC